LFGVDTDIPWQNSFVNVLPSDVDRIIDESLRGIVEALDVSTARV